MGHGQILACARETCSAKRAACIQRQEVAATMPPVLTTYALLAAPVLREWSESALFASGAPPPAITHSVTAGGGFSRSQLASCRGGTSVGLRSVRRVAWRRTHSRACARDPPAPRRTVQ